MPHRDETVAIAVNYLKSLLDQVRHQFLEIRIQ
jgi:hypothetical protein